MCDDFPPRIQPIILDVYLEKYGTPVHGPVLGYAKARGSNKLVALSSKRSSYKRETTDQILFQKLTYGEVHNARDFVKAWVKVMDADRFDVTRKVAGMRADVREAELAK